MSEPQTLQEAIVYFADKEVDQSYSLLLKKCFPVFFAIGVSKSPIRLY